MDSRRAPPGRGGDKVDYTSEIYILLLMII